MTRRFRWLAVGAIPGIGGVTGLIILIPFTCGMDATSAFALLLGMYAVVVTSDTITSVLPGVPGSVARQATIMNGHAMARKGVAARALGAAFICSAVGGVVGAVLLALSIPLAKPLVLAFGMPDHFALATLGLIMVGSLSGSYVAKGMAVACFGLAISMIGASGFNAVPRHWMGDAYLLQTPPLVSIVLGFFAIAEILDLSAKNRNISAVSADEAGGSGVLAGARDVLRHRWLTLRCSAIGVYVGMLPGLGALIVERAAYAHAVATDKTARTFGSGDVRGVIAPESANNAQRGGALMPTLAFGLPGDFAVAILLGAQTIQGIRPGVDMLTTRLDLTFSTIGMLIIANVVAAAALMMWSRYVARLSFVDGHIVAPVVLLFVRMGSRLGTTSMGDLIVMLLAGVFGYRFKAAGWPRPPLVIARVLGPIMETALIISNRTYRDRAWLERPAVLAILALAALTLLAAARRHARLRRERRRGKAVGSGGDLVGDDPVLSLPLGLVLAGIFICASVGVLGMRPVNALFPQIIAVAGGATVLLALAADIGNLRRKLAARGAAALLVRTTRDAALRRALALIGYVAAVMFGIWVLGQKIARPVALGLHLLVWGRYPWRAGLLMGAGGLAVIELLYDRGLPVNLKQPKLWSGRKIFES